MVCLLTWTDYLPAGEQGHLFLGRRSSVDSIDIDDGGRLNSGPTMSSHANHVIDKTNGSRILTSISSSLARDPSRIVYLAELIPRFYRGRILQLLRIHAPYIPAVIVRPIKMGNQQSKHAPPPTWIASLGPHGHGWPASKLPLEVFECIASSLSRDDMLRLRMVNREFEKKVSRRVFKTVVVPFSPEIYAMSSDKVATIALPIGKGKGKGKHIGKGKEKEVDCNHGRLSYQN